jgi:hypothetical protein
VKHFPIVAFLLFSVGLAAQTPRPVPTDSETWHITPGGKRGVISSQMSEADLIAIFGQKNVKYGDVDIGEGQTLPGTILFDSEPTARLEVLWTDNEHKRLPKQAQAFGTESRWKTTADISLGTSLKELERINGKPFRLIGFDVDGEGTVRSWQGGRLEKEFGRAGVIVRLRPSKELHVTAEESSSVGGASDFSSENSVMQKMNPTVYEIIWVFR